MNDQGKARQCMFRTFKRSPVAKPLTARMHPFFTRSDVERCGGRFRGSIIKKGIERRAYVQTLSDLSLDTWSLAAHNNSMSTTGP